MKLITKPTQLLYSLHTDNEQTKMLFKEEIKSLLEDSNKKEFEKADLIAEMFLDLDEKIDYLKYQIKFLNTLKKQLETSKQQAKEIIAKVFEEYGIDRLNGVMVSSLTVTPQKRDIKEHIIIKDEESLIKLGYAKVDEKKLQKALYTDKYNEIEPYIDIEVENVSKPAAVKINKRKIQIPEIAS
ncbi:conserved hypothetical protein [Lebetimonas natsushimae]|uniref:Uncharacterized protein n=1 Tax=Lebetimonas natsushimae TaxID=1936991 RepID=A0A292YAE6_9BACT|nr:siphovirus Gp157 family protein [Lebetimonas natsushimae]GAX87027.1 conserved hypothetical protein [Lebetimonas natsushimae]